MDGAVGNSGATSALAIFTVDRRRVRVELATPGNRDDNLATFLLDGVSYALIAYPERTKAAPPLSRREREIAWQIANGRCTKRIACDLGISRHTTETYVNRIRIKLGVRNRAEMVAALLGALEPEPAQAGRGD
jgi:DNA-binding CsgD family transcriptional regulator